MFTSSCQENLESQEQVGVPILKNGSQSHFGVNCGGDGGDEDDIWREVIYGVIKNILNSSMRIVKLCHHFIVVYLNDIVFNQAQRHLYLCVKISLCQCTR
jgi:hypothetical protein